MLAVSLALTAAAAYYVRAAGRVAETNRFANLVQDAHGRATESLDRYLQVLRGTAGLFAAFGPIDRRSFEAYVDKLDLATQYRGLRGLGFAALVTPAGRASFLDTARQESGPAFHIWSGDDPTTAPLVPPVGGPVSGDAYVVRYTATTAATRGASLGFDMASDPTRWAAMAVARDTAMPVVTRAVLLVRSVDGERHPGFLIYVPIYGPGVTPDSVEGRRRAVVGFVFASFRTDDLFRYLLDGNVTSRLRVRVREVDVGSAGPVVFDSDAGQTAVDPARRSRWQDRFTLSMEHARWTVDASERPAFYMESDAGVVPLILIGGTGVGLVLFAVVRSQAVAHARAERSAAASQRSRRALAASQSRLRRLVDANLIGVFFCDLRGEVSGGNDEFFRLIGQPRGGDGQPLHLGEIAVPGGRAAVARALDQVSRDGVCPAFETAFIRDPRHGGGGTVPVLLGVASVTPSDDDGGHIPGAEAVAFALDLSDRQRAEQDLRAAKEVAEQAREAAELANRSKDQFLAVLSHELRTPLTPVLAVTDATAVDPGLPASVRDELAMIHRNIELEARLIDDLLDLTRVGRGKLQLRPETIDVHRVIADAIAVVPPEDLAAKHLTIDRDFLAPAHHVDGDATRLQQVFWNLVKNAVKFTPDRGRITVRTSNRAVPGGPDELRVQVIDTGLGIEADILPKVFDAFEQGSVARAQASGGLGLGLAISRGLVEAHGGRITADSPGAGRGATFAVDLATVPPPAAERPTVAELPAASGGRFPILLVEDHADTARVLARLLGRAGHTVSVAGSVAEAAVLADGGRFDLLVSDLGLPDGSGTDVVRHFRQRFGDAGGAIALTGFGAEGDVRQTHEAGFDEHLTKPVAFDLLTAAIARVMAGRPVPASSGSA